METIKTKKAILTLGIPGAGKSYILNKNYNLKNWIVINPDAEKECNKSYNPEHPELLHEWSKKQSAIKLNQAIKDNSNIIIDRTHTNTEQAYKTILELQSQEYRVTLLYIKVSLKTALKRNKNRTRTVPEKVIYEKFQTINYAFDLLKDKVDEIKIINND